MAGDWIKLEHVTPDKPEIYMIAGALGVTPEDAFGRCVRVWVWADQQSLDGNALSVTDVTLDAIARRDGFATAMAAAGWLVENSDGTITFPNFELHNGTTAKKRAETNRRVAKHRKNQRDCNSETVTDDANCNAETVTKSVTREEKRREYKKEDTNVSSKEAPEPKKPKRGTRLPDDWCVSPELKTWTAETTGWGLVQCQTVFEQFTDHWKAATGQKATKRDWDAAWRTWVRNELKFHPDRSSTQSNGGGFAAEMQRRMTAGSVS